MAKQSKHYLPELESEVLSMIMSCDNPRLEIVIDAFDTLHIGCFTTFAHQKLFVILLERFDEGKELSQPAIMDDVLMRAPEAIELISLTSKSASVASLLSFCEKLSDKAKLRELEINIQTLNAKVNEALQFQDAAECLLQMAEDAGNDNKQKKKDYFTFAESATESYRLKTEGQSHITTGFNDLDRLLGGGFRRGTLVTLGAPPSCGKTHFGLSLFWNIQQDDKSKAAIFFSMEMPCHLVADRLDSIIMNKRTEEMTLDDYETLSVYRESSNLCIFEQNRVSLSFMRSKCRLIARRNEISVVMVDYLDLCEKPKDATLRSDEKLMEIVKGLHGIAREFNCVVILMTQLNKEALKKNNHRPSMNDAKNTGATAEVSDYWIGLKRIGQWDEGANRADSHLFEVIIDKNRHGQQGIVYLTCDKPRYGEINQAMALQLVKRGDEERSGSASFHYDDFWKGE